MYYEEFRKDEFCRLDKDLLLRKPIKNEELIKEIHRIIILNRTSGWSTISIVSSPHHGLLFYNQSNPTACKHPNTKGYSTDWCASSCMQHRWSRILATINKILVAWGVLIAELLPSSFLFLIVPLSLPYPSLLVLASHRYSDNALCSLENMMLSGNLLEVRGGNDSWGTLQK